MTTTDGTISGSSELPPEGSFMYHISAADEAITRGLEQVSHTGPNGDPTTDSLPGAVEDKLDARPDTEGQRFGRAALLAGTVALGTFAYTSGPENTRRFATTLLTKASLAVAMTGVAHVTRQMQIINQRHY